jgi:5-methylcytosine-specific restriction endonuclease McrA
MYNRKLIKRPDDYDSNIRYLGVKLAVKKAVFERDNYTCQICGISRDGIAELLPGLETKITWSIDHIIPRRCGGTDDMSNLQCVCYNCNNVKGDKFTNEETKKMVTTWDEIVNHSNITRRQMTIFDLIKEDE